VLDVVTRFLIEYALAYRAAGADGVVMAEPLAGVLTPRWRRSFLPLREKAGRRGADG
jgi:uroporphyrinogen decarboxylase